MLRSYLLILALITTPAMAEHKLYLACTDGRDRKTNVPTIPATFHPIVVDLDAKTLSVLGKYFDIHVFNDQVIEARGYGNLNEQSTFQLILTIDRIRGQLHVLNFASNCATQQQGMPPGMCALQDDLYNCSNTPPKPKF
jgi:hypothetical protein